MKEKINLLERENAALLIERQREIEEKLYPLRINKQTVIYVTKDKLNDVYKEQWEQKYISRGTESCARHLGARKKNIDEEEVRRLVKEGCSTVEIGKHFGVSRQLIYTKMKSMKISTLTVKERVAVFKSRGMDINQISERMKTTTLMVEKYYQKV